MVAVAIAVACGNVLTSALENRAGAVANAARIHGTHAIVFVVANTIVVFVGFACTTTFTQGVEFVAFAIAGPLLHEFTGAVVQGRVGVEVAGFGVRTARTCGEFAGAIIDRGIRVVVAGTGISATLATQVLTIGLVGNGVRIIVAGTRISASKVFRTHLQAIAIFIPFLEGRIGVIAVNGLITIGLPKFGTVDVEGGTNEVGLIRIAIPIRVNVTVASF